MLKVSEALERICKRAKPLGVTTVPLEGSLGHVLAEDIVARFNLPNFNQSAVDGYAVGSERFKFKLLDLEIKAGDVPNITLNKDEAVRIFTGAIVPDGTYAVVPQENVNVSDGYLEINKVISRNENIRFEGEDISKGDVVLESGKIITPPIVALLASMGYSLVKVYKKPRIAIITTGNELISIRKDPPKGKVIDSNIYQMKAIVQAWGLNVVFSKRVPDDLDSIVLALKDAFLEADVVITSGGISIGEYDLIREALKALGVRKDFWQVLQKPGKPLFFGVKGRKLFFGLPGNPVAVSICMYIYVRAAVRKMMGLECDVLDDFIYGILSEDINKSSKRLEFIRAIMRYPKDRKYLPVVKPIEKRGSHMLTSMADANAILIAPEGISFLEHCEEVKVLPVNWFGL